MKTMFVGGFGAAGHSYWMGQQIAPLQPTPRQPIEVRAAATPPGPAQGPSGAPPSPSAVPPSTYTIPVINQQVPGTILGIPTKTVVIGGAVVLGVVVLTHVL